MMDFSGKQLIGSQWEVGNGKPFHSTSPATGEMIWSGACSASHQVDDAVAAAHEAFGPWARSSIDDRLRIIDRYTEIAKERAEQMALLISQESGKALWDARTEAGALGGKAAVSLKAYHERTPTRRDSGLELTHRPHGVCAVIGPFNFPAHLPNGHIIPALIAGNTVVFKPSEQTPAVAELMASWWVEAGLPPGVLNMVHGAAGTAQELIGDSRVRGVFFTGGVHAGIAIHRALGGHPDKILALELGGNNPLVAWDVADAEAVARIVARSAFITAGQRCTCARRLIVPTGPQGDAIVDAVAALIPKLRVDLPDADPDPFMGSLINDRAAAAVLSAQESMIGAGCDPIVRAHQTDAGPAFISPGLIDTTYWKARVDEEVFGPLLQVIRTATFADAIDIANDTRFGLAAGLISDDAQLWEQFRTEIHAGIVNWNRQTTGASGAAPFGGPGLSGNHRPAGYYAADYCAWPMASMVVDGPVKDDAAMPGLIS